VGNRGNWFILEAYQQTTSKELTVKNSNFQTPRNFADCTWVQGYGRTEPLWERVAGYVLAFAIGAGLACLLVAWWSS
jgi:hypothetical protein